MSGGNSSLITDPALRGIGFASAFTGVGGYEIPAGTSTRPALSSKYMAFFTQNDWKATDKLTINLGLRYEVQPGPDRALQPHVRPRSLPRQPLH